MHSISITTICLHNVLSFLLTKNLQSTTIYLNLQAAKFIHVHSYNVYSIYNRDRANSTIYPAAPTPQVRQTKSENFI